MKLTNTKAILCDICKNPVTSLIDKDVVVSAFIVCMPCFARVPEATAEKFLAALSWPLENSVDKGDSIG